MTKKSKILISLSAVGPGLFLIGYNIGTGSVTTMAKTGAEHGMHLFWALVLSCIFTFILMGLSFLVVFFLVEPDFTAIAAGLVPGIPKTPGAMGLVAAIAGTTCSAAVFIMRSTVVAEKGWTVDNLKTEKKDAFVSASMMLFLSAIIMAVAAGTLNVMGFKLENTVEMIHLFEPIGGKIAAFILILGIVGAGLSTIFPIVLIAPWLIADYTGKPRNIHSAQSRWLIFFAMLFAFGTIFLKQRPPAVMIFSQAFQACILPAVAIPILLLINRAKLMKIHKATLRENIGIWAVIIFSFVTTYFAITELF